MDGKSLCVGLLAANEQLACELDEFSVIGSNFLKQGYRACP